MNRIEKTATFVVALAITFAGATFATAPLALAGSHSGTSHHHAIAEHVLACNTCAPLAGGDVRAIARD